MAVLTRWQPLRPTVAQEVNRMLDNFFAGSLLGGGHLQSWGGAIARWKPAVDVFERGGDLVVRVELPGVDPERDVEISADATTLTIRGERHTQERTEGERTFRMESSYGSFERTLSLPEGVDPDSITASHAHGVLEVVVPRATRASTARKIPVTTESREQQTLDA